MHRRGALAATSQFRTNQTHDRCDSGTHQCRNFESAKTALIALPKMLATITLDRKGRGDASADRKGRFGACGTGRDARRSWRLYL